MDNVCVNRIALWNFVAVLNVILDISLIILPLAVVWNLQVSLKRKVVVFGCFASRSLYVLMTDEMSNMYTDFESVVAAVIFQLIVTNGRLNSLDSTFDYWPIAVSMSISECLSIVTACIPYLKPFMDSLESGRIRGDNVHPRDTSSQASKYGVYRRSGPSSKNSKSPTKNSVQRDNQVELDFMAKAVVPTTTPSVTAARARESAECDAESHSSQTQIIKQVKTWGVSVVRGS